MMGTEEREEMISFRRGGSHGMKEDLSEITRALGRQLRGVAAFLAPPPPPPPTPTTTNTTITTTTDAANSTTILFSPSPSSTPPSGDRIRNDLEEIGGSFQTRSSAISNIRRSSPDKDGGSRVPAVVGVTEEVLEFVLGLTTRPEEWVQCPVPLDSHFDMSGIQREHIATVERLVPSLAALKVNLCPSRISEESFWKIYFLLLHPWLSEHDSELLSTPQIVKEMDGALQELKNRIIARLESFRAGTSSPAVSDNQVQREVSENTETTSSWVHAVEQGNADQWLEEDGELLTSADARKQLGNEYVLFSDLENDDNHVGLRRHTSWSSLEVAPASSPGSSSEWVPLRNRSVAHFRRDRRVQPDFQEQRPVDGESSDWLDAGDSDSTLG